jgi:hypothetical protein
MAEPFDQDILCCATDNTFLYAGGNDGKIWKYTISSGLRDPIPFASFSTGDVPVAMAFVGYHLFVGMDSGRIYKIFVPNASMAQLPSVPGRILGIAVLSTGARVITAIAGGRLYSTDLT